jgi:CheY-like chemotaxis protein
MNSAMKRTLKCIMLIDDNRHDNFFHERVIRKADVTQQVIIHKKASDAINQLLEKDVTSPDYPELIFLDINMPGMNGWEFLEAFRKMTIEKQAPVIVMLTTSNNPDDLEKAKTVGHVLDFKSKPLSGDMLEELINRHFG